MTSARWFAALLVSTSIAVSFESQASAQWQGLSIALRTSGSVVRSGDCLRLELLALDAIPGPLQPQVTYSFTEAITVRDEDGTERTATRSRRVLRPPLPQIDQLDRFQSVLLDDTFCFGQNAPPGRYMIDVALAAPASGHSTAALHSCVLHDDGATPPAEVSCSLLMTGVSQADASGSLTLSGRFPLSGDYHAALLRGNRVIGALDAGVSAISGRELLIVDPALAAAQGQTVDLLILDRATGFSTTLSKLLVPRPR